MVNPHIAGTYNSSVVALGNVSRKTPFTNVFYNATVLNSSFNANDTFAFAILANDSVGNNNLTNGSFNMPGQNSASFFFNITLDGNAPFLSNVSILNSSSLFGYNVTPSNRTLTVSVNANDTTYQYQGNSGVSSVVVYTSDNASKTTALSNNGGLWSTTGSLQNFGANYGDHKITLTFIAKDAVGNENTTSLSVEIDDYAPQFSLNSNYTNNFTTTNNSQINITASISNNLNLTQNVTINGPNGLIFNASLNVGTVTSTINGTSTWFTAKLNVTGGIFPTAETGNHTLSFSNLSQYGCPGGAETDGFVCQLQLNATDIFGRPNSTNITITLDNVPPAIVNITMNNTAASQRSNIAFRGGTQLNFTVNAYNNIVNATIGNRSISSLSHVMPVVAGNYSFVINVSDFCVEQGACTINFTATDKAGNYNSSLVDSEGASFLILRDDIAPNVTAPSVSGGNFTGPGSLSNTTLGIMNPVRIARSDRIINLTVNSVDYNSTTTVLNVTVQNSTAATMALWNSSSDWYNITTLGSLGCSPNVETQCIITFNATDNASNINSSVASTNQSNLTFRVDDLTPRVVNLTTTLTSGIGRNVTSVNTVINFLVNVSDANIWNVTIQNTTVIKMNGTATTGNTTTMNFSAYVSLSSLGCASDGDCYVTINATDLAGNINASQSITVTSDSASLSINNRTQNALFYFDSTPTFNVNTSKAAICRYSTTGVLGYSQMTTPFDNNGTRHSLATLPTTADGRYTYDVSCVDVTGANEVNNTVIFTIDTVNDTTITIMNWTNTGSVFISPTPTVHVNTSNSSTCRYSNVTGTTAFSNMKLPFNVNGTRHNSFTISGDLRDKNDYAYPVACTTANEQNEVAGTVRFAVDTRSLWNVTIGINGYNAGTGADTYFTASNKFYSFQMDNDILLSSAGYLSGTTVNVSNVLVSILSANPSGSTNNLTILYALNATSGTVSSYVPGRATGNTLNNFTANGLTYYANFSAANERIEIT